MFSVDVELEPVVRLDGGEVMPAGGEFPVVSHAFSGLQGQDVPGRKYPAEQLSLVHGRHPGSPVADIQGEEQRS